MKSSSLYILTAAALLWMAAARLPARAGEPLPSGQTLECSLRLALVPLEPVLLPPVDGLANENRLTLTEAEQLAAAGHPALQAAEGEVEAARGRWLQVGLLPNPEVGYAGQEIGNEGMAGQQGGFASQEIVTSRKLGLNRSVAMRDVEAAQERLARARLRVVTTVRTMYFEALSAERSVALARQLVAVAAQAVKASELRLEAMEGTRAELLQSQVERDSADLLEASATNRYEAAWRRLAAAIDRDAAAPEPLEDVLSRPLPALTWEPVRDRLLADSPELAELRLGVERAKWAVERATAGRVPNVDLQAGVAYDNAADDTIANVQVSMPLPVFDRNQGGIAEACGQLAAARAALSQRELELDQRLAAALRDYESARQRVAKYQESILPAARQSLDMVAKAYDQGELDYLQLLSTQRVYTEKNLAYLQDLETAWKKWAEIEGLLVAGPDAGSN